MANFTAEIVIENRIGAAVDKLRSAVSAKLASFGDEVMEASQQMVPVDTGDLMGTGRVEPVQQDGDLLTVTLGYGGPAVDYALKVHENLDPHVHWQRPGSGPKYLENPLKERQGQLEPALAEAVKVSLG